MGVSDEEDDWNSTSGKDDGDDQGRDDEVEVVIQTTPGVSDLANQSGTVCLTP